MCALLVDGTSFKGESLIAALGIDRLGNKSVLGLVQGATENAAVVGDLRWVASALVYVESRRNRIHGRHQIPALINALKVTTACACKRNALWLIPVPPNMRLSRRTFNGKWTSSKSHHKSQKKSILRRLRDLPSFIGRDTHLRAVHLSQIRVRDARKSDENFSDGSGDLDAHSVVCRRAKHI